MQTKIAGIPCQVEVISITGRHLPAKIWADPNDCYEAEYPELEWRVLDRKGYPAPWLERKLTEAAAGKIEAELLTELENKR